MTRTELHLDVDLQDGEDTLTIVLKGKRCRIQDLQDMISALLRQETRAKPADVAGQPCGCEGE